MSATKRASPPIEAMHSESTPTRTILDAKIPPRKRATLGKPTSNTPQPSTNPSKSSKSPKSSSPTSSKATSSSSEAEASSSSAASSESESEDEIPLIRPLNSRPVMRVSALGGFGASEGLNNLPDFLKQMKEANEELMKKMSRGEERGLEDVREGESYVEMNLGLGVLEETREGGSGSESESGSEVEEEDADGDKKMAEGKKVGIEEV
ncbi:hypothetical protein DSL72_000352 [Monilinia vaccinii-corymbosi]|uniref:Uncharacterized protein n=1 Tax=Monilinia vaccinii-corymbosi TaxID=61207 RepID=A0A8A3P442_9HELO|nr:hypothetical protein DSL72_000352 [Monilinia vaccinii-corymbosi]